MHTISPLDNKNDLSYRVSTTPKELWIELTSKCPFKCIFCSRELLRKNGEHMDFNLYIKIINSLESPRVIRLNYSGESLHYPRIIEAIIQAKNTGAMVELVTTLSSIKEKNIPHLVQSGLDRLTISVHTTDEEQYKRLYGYGDFSLLKQRLKELQNYKATTSRKTPLIDFAYVAMQRNLNQLENIAKLANDNHINHIDIHPIIRRDEIPETFEQELRDGKLRESFLKNINQKVEHVHKCFPNLTLAYSTPEPDYPPENLEVSNNPIRFPWKLNKLENRSKIWTCDQNPWDTVHILSNGDVVPCEVQDQLVLGNLHKKSLKEIWHSDSYKLFRHNYYNGKNIKCNNCPYKSIYLPSKPLKNLGPINFNSSQLINGWHDIDKGIVWSTLKSKVIIRKPKMSKMIEIKALLPGVTNKVNTLDILFENQIICHVENPSNEMLTISEVIKLDSSDNSIVLSFHVSQSFIPSQSCSSSDNRILGFALQSLTWND